MTDYDQVATAIRQANPWAEGAAAADGEWSTAELLSQIEDRRETMRTIERKTLQPAPQPKRNRRPGLLIAAAAVAAVVIVGGVIFATLGRDNSTDVAGRPDLTPADLSELAWESLENGDVDGFLTLLSPDLVISEPGGTEMFFEGSNETDKQAGLALEWYAASVSIGVECTAVGNVATCEFTPVSPLGVKDESGQPTLSTLEVITFTVENGLVTEWERDASFPGFDQRRLSDYEAWLETNYPEDHAELFAFGSMIYEDFDGAARHRAFIQEWASTQ